jgi:outer membrane protein
MMPALGSRHRFVLCFAVLISVTASAQKAPPTASEIWVAPATEAGSRVILQQSTVDPEHRYTLAELIDLAQRHNPQTRLAWQQAKQRAEELGIARSELLPTLIASVGGNTSRQGVLFGSAFVRQTVELVEPMLEVNYTIFDFGARSGRIAAARQQLLAANFSFNAVQLALLFDTSQRYYRLLNAMGQREAAETNLRNAQTVQRAVDARLANGLATRPDALEARAEAAQADYELQAAVGQIDIARGDLLTIVGTPPSRTLNVQPLNELHVPDHEDEEAEAAIQRGLNERPELAQRIAIRRAADASIRQARSAYFPSLALQGNVGETRAYGRQDLLPGTYVGPVEAWNASLNFRWTVFDGGRRKAELARSVAEQRAAEAAIDVERDNVEEEVWIAYADLQTAFRQHRAAIELLTAANSSYEASLKSYNYGLRNTVDVVSAQRTLAQAISQDVAARTNVLTQLSALAYRTGSLLRTAKVGHKP